MQNKLQVFLLRVKSHHKDIYKMDLQKQQKVLYYQQKDIFLHY